MKAEQLFDSTVPFEERLNRVLQFQMDRNPVYRRFAETFGISPGRNYKPKEIPLLPIQAFKEASLIAEGAEARLQFRSSGTGSMDRSTHHVADAEIYHRSIRDEFFRHFSFKTHTLFCYTPGYAENKGSSLIYMLKELTEADPSGLSRFLPLGKPLTQESLKEPGKPILLFGAAFGLLDLIDFDSAPLPEGSEIVETGGMKTHRRSMSKNELRIKLSEGFETPIFNIHSEYGMCELLSQCYAIGGEWFSTPDWVDVSIRRADNPSELCMPGEEGKIGIIDLANVWSCPFLLTGDRGVMNERGEFRVLGRWNRSDLRGCNFLIDSEL
ncbi:MAG: hypothetical protein JJU46_06010 [Balneolaceae bacterium]|nr:hypothetical protein [Balneolaceae bacterium]MCH8547344.1 hypothetical protein [Balneolaceae bacterium]